VIAGHVSGWLTFGAITARAEDRRDDPVNLSATETRLPEERARDGDGSALDCRNTEHGDRPLEGYQ
jgi:hypothetical protein